MDEVYILSVIGAAVSAGVAGVVWGRGTVQDVVILDAGTETVGVVVDAPAPVEDVVEAPVAVAIAATPDHVHERDFLDTNDDKGWRCNTCWREGVYTPMPQEEKVNA